MIPNVVDMFFKSQAPQTEAIRHLLKLSAAADSGASNIYSTNTSTTNSANGDPKTTNSCHTPVDILLVLNDTITAIRDAVDNTVKAKFPDLLESGSAEFATDDLLLVLVWVVAQVVRLCNDQHPNEPQYSHSPSVGFYEVLLSSLARFVAL